MCKETRCSFLILNIGWEDELVAFVYHEETKNEVAKDVDPENGKNEQIRGKRKKNGEESREIEYQEMKTQKKKRKGRIN